MHASPTADPMDPSHMHQDWRVHDNDASPDERTWATLTHLTILTSLISLPVLGALILWAIKHNESPFLDDHGKEAMNFQISLLLYSIAAGFLTLACGIGVLGLVLIPALGVWGTIVAIIASQRGDFVRYPMSIRLIN